MVRRLDLPDDQIRAWAAAQWTTSEMGAELGCSHKAVRNAMIRLGIPRLGRHARKEKNRHYNGGRTVDKSGYVLLNMPEHPSANRAGFVREHRYVMEQHLGRLLTRVEVVDHIDGNTSNNALENLRLFANNGEHLHVTRAGKVPNWSPDGKRRLIEAARKPRRRRSSQRQTPTLAGSENGAAQRL